MQLLADGRFDLFSAFSLVVSVLVLLYLASYAVVLYYKKKEGLLRWDWRISSIFYSGIALMALSRIVAFTDNCVFFSCPSYVPGVLDVVALVLFVYGFMVRSATSERMDAEMKEFLRWKKEQAGKKKQQKRH